MNEQGILQAIAALADGLRARDAQLTAISEQIRIMEQRFFTGAQNADARLAGIEQKLSAPPVVDGRMRNWISWCNSQNAHSPATSQTQIQPRKAKRKR